MSRKRDQVSADDTISVPTEHFNKSKFNFDVNMQSRTKLSVLEHLHRREQNVVRCHPKYQNESIFGNRDDTPLSYAWDVKRLQNMILAVGPGTPAYEIYHPFDSDSSHGSYCSEEIFEDDDDSESDNEETNIVDNNRSSTTSGFQGENELANNQEHVCNQNRFQISEEYVPSMKHRGCINTSTWLDTGWQISRARTEDSFLNAFVISDSYSSNSKLNSIHSLESEECPTQLITAGDDTCVKIWDVEMSMGRASPIPSSITQCPFGYTDLEEDMESSNIVKQWKSRYRYTDKIPGLVKLMCTIKTNHRGNIFHAIPAGVDRKGKILTCAADGTVRMSDIDHQSSSGNYNASSQIIVQSQNDYFDDRMLYSIHMLDQNTGLLCAEKGLKRFDVRMNAHSQTSGQLLLEIDGCKSCAAYSTSSEESSYVFTNNGIHVCLYDLRFASGQRQNIVQRYKPYDIDDYAVVSGIDLSKDRKELLVSYENDHIYTFPVFPNDLTSPNIDEILSLESRNNEDENVLNYEFASYGGHLNRYTFLKCAKYAGPKDEYICTGSDSGHAFIYDKKSCAVVSLLKTDTSTCNGIVPHPTLPIFVTYGINSSAKLWRASIPVDDKVDDSIGGRRLKYKQKKYVGSFLSTDWDEVQERLSTSMNCDEHFDTELFPEEVILDPMDPPGGFEDLSDMFFRTFLSSENPFKYTNTTISNDLMNLPEILAKNLFETLTLIGDGDQSPVQSDVDEIRRRISIIRLNHQAQELGVCLDSTGKQPWNLIEIQSHHKTKVPLSSADTIPNFPSDWLPFDPRFTVYNALGGCNFQKKNYEKFFERFYKCKEYHREDQVKEQSTDSDDDDDDDGDDNDDGDNDNYDMDIKQAKASDVLHNTIKQLKEEGNKASKEGNIHLAASYYDKALRYCSIVFMHYNFSNIILADQYFVMHLKNGYNVDWSPLFKTYISVLLNLGLVNLKPEINDPETAARQLKFVLELLFPFVKKPGMIVTVEGPNLEKQPIEIYKEAKEFEAKAYFRLGSAMMEMKKFTHAIAFYEECLESQKSIHPDSPPDKHILRKLSIAKNQAEKKKRRDRKRAKYSYVDVFLHDDSD